MMFFLQIPSSSQECTGTKYRDTCEVNCNEGYEKNNASSGSYTCEADGKWSGEKTVCIPKDCGAPPQVKFCSWEIMQQSLIWEGSIVRSRFLFIICKMFGRKENNFMNFKILPKQKSMRFMSRVLVGTIRFLLKTFHCYQQPLCTHEMATMCIYSRYP